LGRTSSLRQTEFLEARALAEADTETTGENGQRPSEVARMHYGIGLCALGEIVDAVQNVVPVRDQE